MRHHAKPGFTLLEVILVIALLGAIIAIAWPEFAPAAEARRLMESGERLRALCAMCRAEAMNTTAPHRILLVEDGSIRVRRQADPVKAPHLSIEPRDAWARGEVLLEGVWVSAVQILPEGPPPIRIVDEELEFPETVVELIPIEEFEWPVEISFEPDGTSNSLRWVLRDVQGRALMLTLDGRLGRVTMEEWEALSPDEVVRPEPVDEEAYAEDEFDPEDYK